MLEVIHSIYQQQIKDLSLKPNPCCIEELDIASSIAIFHGHWSTLNRTSIVSAFSLQLVCPYPVLMSLDIPNTTYKVWIGVGTLWDKILDLSEILTVSLSVDGNNFVLVYISILVSS